MNEGEDTIVSPLMGFALDASSIETKLAQVKAVASEYGSPLGSGAVDSEKLTVEMTEKFGQAGVQDVIDEVQSQVDAFLATK